MDNDIVKLDAFGHGFFRGVLNVMDTIGRDSIIREEVEDWLEHKLHEPMELREERALYQQAEQEMRWFNKKRCGEKRVVIAKTVSSQRGSKKESVIKGRQQRRR